MSHWSSMRCVCRGACALVSLVLASSFVAVSARAHVRGNDPEPGAFEAARQQLVVHLRSFVPGASGRVVVEANEAGGRVRLLASNLPAPAAVAPEARAFIVWATGGEVRRVGELRRGARGNAAFEFAHPTGFESYSLVVTAERDARSARPAGAFVFSTRAGEVSAFYPPPPEPRAAPTASTITSASAPALRSRTVTGEKKNGAASLAGERARKSSTAADAPAAPSSAAARTASPTTGARALSSAAASEFYESIDAAVEDPAGGRTLTLAGLDGARRARGAARVATREGTAYVRVRFRNVPSPRRFGARRYVMWAQLAEDRALFLRALPSRHLNRRATYARRRDVNSSDFRLLVTAERRSPRPRPLGRKVLRTVNR